MVPPSILLMGKIGRGAGPEEDKQVSSQCSRTGQNLRFAERQVAILQSDVRPIQMYQVGLS
jgi:hypothetical protein